MADFPFKMSLSVTCDCGHSFKIDPIGVSVNTDIICPSCSKADHLDQKTFDRVDQELLESLMEAFEDGDILDGLYDAFQGAPEIRCAKII